VEGAIQVGASVGNHRDAADLERFARTIQAGNGVRREVLRGLPGNPGCVMRP
jgi:hypothetical protein